MGFDSRDVGEPGRDPGPRGHVCKQCGVVYARREPRNADGRLRHPVGEFDADLAADAEQFARGAFRPRSTAGPTPLLYASPTQLNIQVPYEAGAGPAVLGINNNGQIAGYLFQVAPSSPGIVSVNGAISPTASAKQGAYATLYVTGVGDVTEGFPTGPRGACVHSLGPVPVAVAAAQHNRRRDAGADSVLGTNPRSGRPHAGELHRAAHGCGGESARSGDGQRSGQRPRLTSPLSPGP